VRTTIAIRIACAFFALTAACGDDDSGGSGGTRQDSGANGADTSGHSTGGSGGRAALDASSGGGSGRDGGHASGSGGSQAHDAGARGSGSHDAGRTQGSGGHDAGAKDAGSDSGADAGSGGTGAGSGGTGAGSGGTGAGSGGSGSCTPCGNDCCTNTQVCAVQDPATVSAGWGANADATVLHVVQGSTVTFDTHGVHNVNLFADESAYATCSFDADPPLATSGVYSWSAATVGDFYFGCSIGTHCVSGHVKKHVVVDAAGLRCH
jgi:hypothetical protein